MWRRLATYLRWRRYLIWSALAAAVALVLCFIPLFDLLGYEFSLVMALVASLGAGHIAAAYPSRVNEQLAPFPGARYTVAKLYLVCAAYGLSLLVVPLVLISANALRVRNCDFSEGFGFYLLGPIASVLVGAGWGLAWGLALSTRRLSSIAWVVWWVGALGLKLYDAWATPAVRALGSYHGYFSGVLYDEAITLPLTLLTFRLRDAVEVSALLAVCAWLIDRSELRLRPGAARERKKIGALALALMLLAGLGFALDDELGHRRTAEEVAEALGGRTEHGRCVLIHPDWLPADRAELMARDCAFRLDQVESYLGVELSSDLQVFLFSDPEEKQELIGAGRTSVAKPWRREVYIQGDLFPHPVLKHEIVHVVAGEFGAEPLRISGKLGGILASPGLIEGVAVAADWDEPELTPHQWSKAMHELDVAPPIPSILGLDFLGLNSSRAYVLAGSFSRFLIETYGMERYRRAYRTADPAAVYERSLGELEREWLDFLDEVPLREGDLVLAKARFLRPAVFDKVCAHEVAQLRQRASHEEATGDWDEALQLRLRIERYTDRDARSQLERARTLLGMDHGERAAMVLEQLTGDERAARDARRAAQQLRADMLWSRGEREEALEIYHALLDEPAYEPDRRMLAVKVAALEEPRAQPYIKRFLLGGDRLSPEEPALAMLTLSELIAEVPSFAIGHYLIARQLFFRDEFERAVTYLRRARDLGLPTEPLSAENLRLLAISLFRLGRFDDARDLFETLAGDPSRPRGAQALARDWIERIEWEAEQRSARRGKGPSE